MRICTLASGSKGNCTFVSAGNTNILIDFGISYREFLRRLESAGLEEKVSAILVTHTHADHIKGISQILSNCDVPIYAHRKMQADLRKKVGIEDLYIHTFDNVFRVGEVDVLPFATPHDTELSFGYTLSHLEKRLSVVTDLGHVSDKVFSAVSSSDLVLLEANYDVDMLIEGSYPKFLKHRILSPRGHLSNCDCAKTCCDLARSSVKKIILGHISENNNTPDIALLEVREALQKENLLARVQLYIAEQYEAGNMIEV